MIKNRKTIEYLTGNIEELTLAERSLVDIARAECRTAYAPHSNFRVGAAALLSSGEIMCASNQESEVFPSGMCAERVLLFYTKSKYPTSEIVAIAIAAQREGQTTEQEIYPCGACVQTLIDVEKRQKQSIKIILTSSQTYTIIDSARTLLPFQFTLSK